MTNRGEIEPTKARGPRQVWVQYLFGGAGMVWLISWLGRTYWSISSSLTLLGSGIWLAILVCTVLFAVNLFLPFHGEVTDVGDAWSFIRGPRPQDPTLRSEWWRLRRHLTLTAAWLALWMCYGVAVTLGLARS